MTWDPHTALYSKIMFERGERIAFTLPCEIMDPDVGTYAPGGLERLARGLKSAIYTYKGVVVATNRRIMLLTQQGGDHRLRDEIRLEDIQSIGLEKQLAGDHALSINFREGGRVRERAVRADHLNIEHLSYTQQHIMVLKQARLKEIEEERRRERVQYVIDFSFLKSQMEKGGLAVTAVKCPNCGASVDLPTQGEYFTCQYCKSTIHAMDIFDKMKGLLQGL